MTESMPDTSKMTTRDELVERLTQRMAVLSEKELRQWDAWSAGLEPVETAIGSAVGDSTRLSRRQFFSTVAISSAALVASNAVTAVAQWDRGTTQGQVETEARLLPRLASLQSLVELYKKLEATGLDEAVVAGLTALGPLIKVVASNGGLLLLGIILAEKALDQLDGVWQRIRDGLDVVDDIVDRLEERIAGLWRLLGDVTGVAVPITDAIGAFFTSILAKIPFGIGAKIQQVIDWIQELIAQLPEALATMRANLLGPLRLEWFDDESENNLRDKVIVPVRDEVLLPARALIAEIERLDADWDVALQQPLEQALAERQQIRAEIVAHESSVKRV